jgi:hypothetical protein
MQAFIVSVVLLAGVLRAEPDCKAVEFGLPIATYTTAYPIDVCYSQKVSADDGQGGTVEVASSFWLYCTNDAEPEIWMATYGTEDCSGKPTFQAKFEDNAAYTGYTVTGYCSKPACEYATVSTYVSAVSCSTEDTSSFEAYSSVPMISGYCNSFGSSSLSYTCSGSTAQYNYFLNGDCSGDAFSSQELSVSADITCQDPNTGVGLSSAISIECGEAHFAGELNTQNSDESNPIATTSGAARVYGAYILGLAALAALFHA